MKTRTKWYFGWACWLTGLVLIVILVGDLGHYERVLGLAIYGVMILGGVALAASCVEEFADNHQRRI